MEKVTGIGGVFFRARDPQALAAWYELWEPQAS
jgi:glyoxylase I family protein